MTGRVSLTKEEDACARTPGRRLVYKGADWDGQNGNPGSLPGDPARNLRGSCEEFLSHERNPGTRNIDTSTVTERVRAAATRRRSAIGNATDRGDGHVRTPRLRGHHD